MVIPVILAALIIGQVSSSPIKVSHKPLPASGPADPLAWTNEEWRGNDQPFEKVRSEIDSTKLTPDLIDKYNKEAEQHPTDALARFRWGYAYYQAWKQHVKPFSLSHPILWMTLMGNFALGSYHREPLSHTYEYMRLMFLMANGGPLPNDNAELAALGRRLLKQTPNDYDVEYHLISCLDVWKSPKLRQEALGYAQDLVSHHPDKPSVYASLGNVYFLCWYVQRSKGDAESATKWFQEYLKRAQSDDPWKQQAEQRITYIQTHLNLPYNPPTAAHSR